MRVHSKGARVYRHSFWVYAHSKSIVVTQNRRVLNMCIKGPNSQYTWNFDECTARMFRLTHGLSYYGSLRYAAVQSWSPLMNGENYAFEYVILLFWEYFFSTWCTSTAVLPHTEVCIKVRPKHVSGLKFDTLRKCAPANDQPVWLEPFRKIVASFEPARFSKRQQTSANVSECQQMSASVSKCQQMSA